MGLAGICRPEHGDKARSETQRAHSLRIGCLRRKRKARPEKTGISTWHVRSPTLARYDLRKESGVGLPSMRRLGVAVMIVIPLLLAACGDDSDKPDANAAPDGAAPTARAQLSSPAAPAENAGSVPLRQTPGGLIGSSRNGPSEASPAPPQEPPQDAPPSEAEVRALYEGIVYTYAFDACGLPLIGERARQDIEQRIEICPNPPLRKDAFRTIYHRAIEVAEQDPEKTRSSASKACPDKHEFLR